ELSLQEFPGNVFKGKVSRFADSEDPTSRTMHTEIDLPNPDDRLRPGMYGIATINLDRSTKNATLPASCLVGEAHDGKASVLIVREGVAKKVGINIAADDGIRVEVLEGLGPKDDVIARPSTVSDGMPVRASKDAAYKQPARASQPGSRE